MSLRLLRRGPRAATLPPTSEPDFRQLLPTLSEQVDAEAAYLSDERHPPAGRPWVVLDMVSSIDGATSVQGRSGALGGEGDRVVFRALRAAADVVLAGAGTVRAEHYGPPRLTPRLSAERGARGRPPLPRIAVVSGSLSLDLTSELFTQSPTRPIVITSGTAPHDLLDATSQVADVVVAGDDDIDMADALGRLRELGAEVVVCEGGPTLNGHLFAHGLVDELCMTVAPAVVAGTSHRLVGGEELQPLVTMQLARVLLTGDELFLRYVRVEAAR